METVLWRSAVTASVIEVQVLENRTDLENCTGPFLVSFRWYISRLCQNCFKTRRNSFHQIYIFWHYDRFYFWVNLKEFGKRSKKKLGPFYNMHWVNKSIKFLTGHCCGDFFVSSTKRVTVQYFVVVIEGISGETQRAVWKVNLKVQPEFSGKIQSNFPHST